jgi:glycosyltransferase involved in cell wall biosynthesis
MISIITICFNNLEDLIKTNKSIDMQTNKDFEHLIIDGSSNKEINFYLEGLINPVYRRWICERDLGISDAFNKGIENSCGDVILLLNSGDCLYNKSTIEIVIKEFKDHPDISWLHGKYSLKHGGRNVVWGKPYSQGLLYRGMRKICHQTMYVKKEVYNKYGRFDINEKVCMDYEYLCRMSKESFIFVDKILAVYAEGGISYQSYIGGLNDVKRVYLKHFPYTIKIDIWKYRQFFLFKLLNSHIGKFLFKLKSKIGLENF